MQSDITDTAGGENLLTNSPVIQRNPDALESNTHSNFKSVGQQSGIKAGDGGF